MDIPLQPLLFSIPSIVYICIQRARKRGWGSILKDIGCSGTPIRYLAIGLGIGLVPGLLSFALSDILPSEIFDQSSIAQVVYAEWPLSVASFVLAFLREAFYVALGEEILFRGFLGSMLIRRMGFIVGNLIQSALFLLPHLMLLTISLRLWPLLIAQFAAGWLYGWLLHRSSSVLPSWLAHSLSNAFGALAFMS